MKVYQCINAVQQELSIIGIGKDQKNTQQGFKFRGIDDVLNALSPLLSKYGLCILPNVLSREVTERVTAKGSTLFYVAVKVEYVFVSAEDGSKHVTTVYGEAMDSGDKATNKALSAAYKYACIQAFCIPTEGDNDADATTHEYIEPILKPNKGTMVVASTAQLKPLDQLIALIQQHKLEDKVLGWLEHFKVYSLQELSDRDINKLIAKIKEME